MVTAALSERSVRSGSGTVGSIGYRALGIGGTDRAGRGGRSEPGPRRGRGERCCCCCCVARAARATLLPRTSLSLRDQSRKPRF